VHTEDKPKQTFPLDKSLIIAEGQINESLMDTQKFSKKLDYAMKQELVNKSVSHKLDDRIKGFEAEH
jgi:hypothetical protein